MRSQHVQTQTEKECDSRTETPPHSGVGAVHGILWWQRLQLPPSREQSFVTVVNQSVPGQIAHCWLTREVQETELRRGYFAPQAGLKTFLQPGPK